MAYTGKPAQSGGGTRTLEEIFGQESFEDSGKRTWYVKSFPLGNQIAFRKHLARLFASPEEPSRQIAFIQAVLFNPVPTPYQRIKAALGFPHFHFRYLKRIVFFKDFEKFLDAALKANYDMSLDKFIEITQEQKAAGEKKNDMTAV